MNLIGPDGDYQLKQAADVIFPNVVIMTQSCDLENEKVGTVLLCPYFPIDAFALNRAEKEQIRKGYRPGQHLLNLDDDFDLPILVVEFTRVFTSPKATVSAFAANVGSRPRLISPYKEHLSQSFARYFMRVGLPSDIERF